MKKISKLNKLIDIPLLVSKGFSVTQAKKMLRNANRIEQSNVQFDIGIVQYGDLLFPKNICISEGVSIHLIKTYSS